MYGGGEVSVCLPVCVFICFVCLFVDYIFIDLFVCSYTNFIEVLEVLFFSVLFPSPSFFVCYW